jgi:TDG/mug DNA glycosylase family protein
MPVLADLLYPEVRLVVCSTGGERSAEPAAFTGPGNQFWDMLYRVGVTPRVLKPAEFMRLHDHGIALAELIRDGPDGDPAGLRARIEQTQPLVLAFNGKRAAQLFLGRPAAYGYQPGRDIGRTRIYLAPSTAGPGRGAWSDALWQEVMAAAGLHTVAMAMQRPARRGTLRTKPVARRA